MFQVSRVFFTVENTTALRALEAVRQLKNHMDEKFRELYQRIARSEVEAIKGQCALILAEAHGFQQMTPQQQRVAWRSLVRVSETAGVQIAASFGRVVDCITDLSNFRTQKYADADCVPAHLRGHYGLNCEQLKKGVGFVREVESAINLMYTVVGWRLNQMQKVIEAEQMHTRKEHFRARAREALQSVYTDLGAWEDDRRIESCISLKELLRSKENIVNYTINAIDPLVAMLGKTSFFARLVGVEMRPHGGALVRTVVSESLKTRLSQDADAIGQLRQHVQQLRDQI